ncbi:MAG: hypothetical protein U5R31_03180 [Acidimicrobiia bacterium]|nr:hypothetical protein [Acidimicrobiia bacterium]
MSTYSLGPVHTLTPDGDCRPDCPHPDHRRTEMTDEVMALARAIGLVFGHTFADVRNMTPGPHTISNSKAVLAYLAAERWHLAQDPEEAPDAE